MKKNISTYLFGLLAVLFLCTFSSCQKDGVYKPKKQISAIYYKYTGGTKTLEEKWTWNGKLLEKIDYYDNYSKGIYVTAFYKYEKNRLVEISRNSLVLKFLYEGNKLKKIEGWNESLLYLEVKVTHTKNKITTLDFTEYYDEYDDYKSEKNKMVAQAFRGVLPESTCENLSNIFEKRSKNNAKAFYHYQIDYTYDGNNIKEEKYTYPEDGYEIIYTYKYDKEQNPFYNLLYGGHSYSDFAFSKNNITYSTSIDSDGDIYEAEMLYTYEKGYPIEVTYKNITSGYIGGTTYYEYVK